LIQLEELKLAESLRVADAFRPMIQEMEDYLNTATDKESSYLHNPFAEKIVAIAKQVSTAVKVDLNQANTADA
jgi:hypothetical protein